MLIISLTIGNRTFATEFIKSEDAGYSPGRLLLDLPSGDMLSIYKRGRKWIEARIKNGICRSSIEHATRQAALNASKEIWEREYAEWMGE